MISHSDITIHSSIPEYSGEDVDGIFTLENIKNAIQERMNNYGIPVTIEYNEIKSGSLFKSSIEDCITIANSEHIRDYYSYCITIRKQGVFKIISTYIYGNSSLATSLDMYNASGAQDGGFVIRTIGKLIKPNEQKIKEEKDYYQILNNCIMSILSGKE